MDIVKVVGIGFVAALISNILKEYKKEYAIYALLVGCMIIFLYSLDTLKQIVVFIKKINQINVSNIPFLEVLLKTTGIAILVEYSVSICKDLGENSIANKIDFGGKLIIISLTIPVISESLNTLLKIMP